jgi:hypothetical protein
VDPALVHHYFGTKHKVFLAAIELPLDPLDVVRPLREVPIDELGPTLVRTVIGYGTANYKNPESRCCA